MADVKKQNQDGKKNQQAVRDIGNDRECEIEQAGSFDKWIIK